MLFNINRINYFHQEIKGRGVQTFAANHMLLSQWYLLVNVYVLKCNNNNECLITEIVHRMCCTK